jgi:hypothetical protein
MKLGKKSARLDKRTLFFRDYLDFSKLNVPDSCDWGNKVSSWGMMKNDVVGDCTCASAGHLIMDWTANEGIEEVPQDEQIISAYSEITGYDPETGLNDNGAVELDVLNYWRNKGIGGHKIYAYTMLHSREPQYLKATTYLFGGAYIGLALPVSAQNQEVWDVADKDNEVGSWGGHAVPIVGYNPTGPVCVTWGATKQMTWAFFGKYCDEAYAVLSGDWSSDGLKSPSGFDVVSLQKDLVSIK